MAKILDFTKPHVLRDEAEYDAAIEEIEGLLDSDPVAGSIEYERLEFLSVLVGAYEEKNFPIPDSPPHELVGFMLEQQGRTRADLIQWLGDSHRCTEFLAGRVGLNLDEITLLRDRLGIPADLLISPSPVKLAARA